MNNGDFGGVVCAADWDFMDVVDKGACARSVNRRAHGLGQRPMATSARRRDCPTLLIGGVDMNWAFEVVGFENKGVRDPSQGPASVRGVRDGF